MTSENTKNSGLSADERNFRPTYYEKLGFKNLEDKKSLDHLLKERPLSHSKLKTFSLKFTIPGAQRKMLWKLLLGVTPLNVDNNEFVLEHQTQEYNDLQHTLKVLRIYTGNTPKPQLLLLTWLLRTGKLKFDWRSQTECRGSQYFIPIIETVYKMFESSDIDVYLISKGIFHCVEKFYFDVPKLVECIKSYLEKDDIELYKHFEKIGCLDDLPLEKWLLSCFCGVIHDTSLCKILDKVVSGSSKILVFVAVALLTSSRRTLLSCVTTENTLKVLDFISEETSETIVAKAMDKWQQNGGLLVVGQESKNNLHNVQARLVRGLW